MTVAQQNLEFYRRAHRFAIGSAALHLAVCAALAPFTGTGWLVALVGIPSVLVPAWLARTYPDRPVSRLMAAVGMMFLTALIIQQTGGDMEAHFSFFVMMSVLVVYCDWRPIVLAFLVIAAHHVVFTWLQPLALGFRVWNDTRWDWGHVIVHGSVGAVQAGALSYLAVLLRGLVQGSFHVNAMAEAISDGRLDAEVHAGAGLRNEMVRAMSTMQERLTATMAQVQQAAQSLGAALQEIASGSTDLAARTEESAARTQGTTAEVMAFVEGSRRTLEVSLTAEATSRDVAKAVEEMSGATRQLLSTMAEIDSNSKRVAEIIGVIDGIAFQTNILALNAAVEAARAGEQGRGFAVVAGEVRSLAQRSAQAAREVRTLIQAAVESASDGGRLAGSAGHALANMEGLIARVQALVMEAAQSTRDGQPRLESLSRSLQQIDSSMQQNAAFVEQLSATTASLRDQEAALRTALQVFRSGEATPHPASA
jgi:methyl-accepting chemotaxis protein